MKWPSQAGSEKWSVSPLFCTWKLCSARFLTVFVELFYSVSPSVGKDRGSGRGKTGALTMVGGMYIG